jgi:hypothetical protein
VDELERAARDLEAEHYGRRVPEYVPSKGEQAIARVRMQLLRDTYALDEWEAEQALRQGVVA